MTFVQLPPDGTGKKISTIPVGDEQLQIVALADDQGAPINSANPVPVVIQGNIPVTIASAIEITNDAGNAIPVSVAGSATAIVDMPAQDTPSLPVRTAPQKYWDCSFSQVGSGLLSSEFTQIRAGSGMTISQANGNLVVATGTTVNAEFVARSLVPFNGALTLKEVTTLTQRILNNNFYIELVDLLGDNLAYNIVNTTTVNVTLPAHGYTAANVGQRIDLCALSSVGVPMEGVIASIPDVDTIRFTVAGYPASGSGTLSLTGWNKVELLYTASTATNISITTRRRGWQSNAASVAINTTASGHLASLNIDNGIVSLSDKTLAVGIALNNRTALDQNIPLPETVMYVQIRAKNGASAPSSTTTWTIGMVRVEDYSPSQVSLVSTRQQSLNNSLPVSVLGTVPVSGTVAANSTAVASNVRAGFIAGAGIWYDDSAANLAGAAVFTGTSRDLTVTATATAMANAATYAQELRVSAESDVTGTLWLEVSRDNTNWRRIKSVATAAVTGGGFYAEIIHRPSWRYARVGYTNGAGAQARFSIGSVLMAA